MSRSFFDWRPPEGITVAQVFTDATTYQSGDRHRSTHYVARCRCGATSGECQTRADAIEQLEDQGCPTGCAGGGDR